MNITFDGINILILVAALSSMVYGGLVYARNRNSQSSMAFLLLTTSIASWGVIMLFFRSAGDQAIVTHMARALYVVAALIPASFSYFALQFPHKTSVVSKGWSYLIAIAFVIIFYISAAPNMLIYSVLLRAGVEPFIVFNAQLHLLYAFYQTAMFGVAFFVLGKKYFDSTDVLRTQIAYIFVGALMTTAVSFISNILLPLIGVFDLNWLGQISSAIATGTITYGIFKHNIFNIRVIITELLMFFLWITALMRIIFSDNIAAAIFNVVILCALVLVGLWLIRGVNKEIATRERVQKLASELEHTNERLRELDRHKSEFLSIATHQLRGPLAAIRGNLSMVLDGSYGEVPEQLRTMLKHIFDSGTLMAQTIDDFLNVSRIEQGSLAYSKTDFDCAKLVENIFEELANTAKSKGLAFTLEKESQSACIVHADYAKVRHVFFNIIENAIKYTEHGFVKVSIQLNTPAQKCIVHVSDSGIGIAENEIKTLFEKFVRARGASKINVEGTGLGLYVAREMIEAHGGSISADSDGPDTGSTFTIELPLASTHKGETVKT